MEVYGLTGPSGTGKSTNAVSLAYKKNIPAIIDDGLLIVHGKKVAGTSAKFEKNIITAVKRATFYFQDHAEKVKEAIQFYVLDKILIVGTSHKMVDLIASQLRLGKINHYVNIEDISSMSEIKLALFIRRTKGNHLMPIPFEQVKQSFFKRIIKQGIKIMSPKREIIGETTIVQPDFHKDSLIIHGKVFEKIIMKSATSLKEVHSIEKVDTQLTGLPTVSIELILDYQSANDLLHVINKIQKKINKDFNCYLNLDLYSVDIYVLKLV